MMAWRRLITQVQRHQSQFGKAKDLLTRNYLSPNKFQDCTRNRLFFSQQRFQSSYLGNLTRPQPEAKEASYLKELSNDPKAVIREFESLPSLHTNSLAFSEYIKALAKLDRVGESESLKTLQRGFLQSVREEGSSIDGLAIPRNAEKPTKDGILGTASAPIRTEPPFLVAFIRSIVLIYLFVYAAGALIIGILKGLGIIREVKPILETNTKFSDVKGVDEEAKAELEEIVNYLRNPKDYTHLSIKPLTCVLLCGPPGTDKTMLARAIAGEAGVPFFQSSGSEFNDKYLVVGVLKSMLAEVRADLYESRGSEFDEKCVGFAARKVRDLFAAAKKQSPCVIFIDEIDAVDGSRNHKDFKWESINQWAVNFKRQALQQLLVEIDRLTRNDEGILVISATNFPESPDEILVRSRKIDLRVVIDNPDVEGQRHILESHMSKVLKEEMFDVMMLM